MINNKVKLREYIESDWAHYGGRKPSIKDYVLHNEKWFIYYYVVALRHVEYYINTRKKGVRYLLWWFIYKRLGFKLKFTIYPNTCEEGLAILSLIITRPPLQASLATVRRFIIRDTFRYLSNLMVLS